MGKEKLPSSEELSQVSSLSSFRCDGSSHNSLHDLDSDSDLEFFDPINIDEDEYEDEDDDDVEDDDDNDDDEEEEDDEDDDNSAYILRCRSIDIIKNDKNNKALQELRCRVEDAIINNYIFGRKKIDGSDDLRDVEIWGVPLLPSKNHEGTDIVLMKFLKAKNYKVSDAFRLVRKAMKWRRELKIDETFDEKFDIGLESMWNMQGKDGEGRPVCYYMLGEFKDNNNNRGVRNEKYSTYIRWRFHCVERAVRELGFREGEANSIIQIIDLKDSNSKAKKEFNSSTSRKFMALVHEHYPGLIHKNLFINVSVWYMAVNALNLKFIKKKTKKKYAFVRSIKVTESLLKLLPPENIPVQYGGLRRENDDEFSLDDKVLEAYASPCINHIKIPINEVDVTVTWDVVVAGSNVIYKEEFVPNDDCSYVVLIQPQKKMQGTARNSFHIREPGNIVITIENGTYKKRKVFYRYKCKPSIPLYLFPRSMK